MKVRGYWLLYAVAVLGVNVGGVITLIAVLGVLGYSTTAAPLTFAILACVIGLTATWAILRPALAWSFGREFYSVNALRRLVLRIPTFQARICAVLWSLGAVCISPLAEKGVNSPVVLFIAIASAGAISTFLTYCISLRTIRPIAIEVASSFEDRSIEISVGLRLGLGWLTTNFIPAMDIFMLQTMKSVQADKASMMILGFFIPVSALTTYLLIASVARPIGQLQHAIMQVRHGDLSARVPIYDGSEIGTLQSGFNEMMEGLTQEHRLKRLLTRYIGTDVAAQAIEDDPVLGGKSRAAAILFVDIKDSTDFASSHSPEEVVAALNAFFSTVVEVVARNHGVVNKFEGDAALILFGAPTPLIDAPSHALTAARELQEALSSSLECGIGVSHGRVIAGHIGGSERFEYTVIGDAVNEAARLTELAKNTPGGVLTSVQTLVKANEAERARWVRLKSVELRGRGHLTQLARPLRPTQAERSTF
ncbi:MAG: adenylate/guanylate cyclase domain-containing protein [Corynebacterium sp.]|nr:adenylate/guanylate cyclase domain-containing protein [Corynebacterium sp.]